MFTYQEDIDYGTAVVIDRYIDILGFRLREKIMFVFDRNEVFQPLPEPFFDLPS